MMTTNVKSVLYGIQAVLPHFRERKRGHLITVSSMLGRIPMTPIRSAYSAARAAARDARPRHALLLRRGCRRARGGPAVRPAASVSRRRCGEPRRAINVNVAWDSRNLQEMRTWLTLVGFVVYLSGCSSRSVLSGCDVSCRAVWECALKAPNAVSACRSQCVNEVSDKSEACKDAVSALGECGVNLTCDQLEANDCAAESSAVTAACNDLGGGDAGVADAPNDSNTGAIATSLDRTTIATELGRTETVVVTVTSSGGYTGLVNVRLALGNSVNAPVSWSVPNNPKDVTVPANGSVNATFTLTVPTDAADLNVTLYAHATELFGGLSTATSAITVTNRYTIVYPAGTGSSTAHTGVGPASLTIRAGATIVFENQDSIQHETWGDGSGIPHEQSGGGQPGGAYIVMPTTNGIWYCHTHELATSSRTVTVTP